MHVRQLTRVIFFILASFPGSAWECIPEGFAFHL